MSQHGADALETLPQAGGSTIASRGLRLLCPKCGRAPIFRGWFSMNDHCAVCGRRFNRAPGYLLGSIYFNYGVTAVIALAVYVGLCLYQGEVLTGTGLKAGLVAFCLLFPLWFFRYARSLWIAFDERWDPWPNEEEKRRENAREPESGPRSLNGG